MRVEGPPAPTGRPGWVRAKTPRQTRCEARGKPNARRMRATGRAMEKAKAFRPLDASVFPPKDPVDNFRKPVENLSKATRPAQPPNRYFQSIRGVIFRDAPYLAPRDGASRGETRRRGYRQVMNTMPPGERVREPRLSRKEMDFRQLPPTGSPPCLEGAKTRKGSHGRTQRAWGMPGPPKNTFVRLCAHFVSFARSNSGSPAGGSPPQIRQNPRNPRFPRHASHGHNRLWTPTHPNRPAPRLPKLFPKKASLSLSPFPHPPI